jgi:hypothetical protein
MAELSYHFLPKACKSKWVVVLAAALGLFMWVGTSTGCAGDQDQEEDAPLLGGGKRRPPLRVV